MKLASYRWNGETHCGVFSGGRLYRLGSRIIEFLQRAQSPQLADLASLPSVALEEVQLLPPVPAPEKIICIGLNYRDHARETGMEIPKHPIFFAKYRNALAGPYDPIVLPRASLRCI